MKMWDGRFSAKTDELMDLFNNSLPVDKELILEDIDGNAAWAKALLKCGILTQQETDSLLNALEEIRNEHREGRLRFLATDEDIHMAIERLLTEKVGDAGAKIHTGRSRNDQVANDFRLFTKRRLSDLRALITRLQQTLLTRAEQDIDCLLPGYTHLQQAQPILISHYWLSFFWALEREKSRFSHATASADVCVLGSGALAGAGFSVDRDMIAHELGFTRVSENSLDSVASRDFVLEALSCIASLGILMSRYAEDLIIWSSREFGYLELDDAWSTGSSMMPQKKNPDSLELIRGKTGRLTGNYMRLATTLKGVGLTYYKDLQEDKEALIDSIQQSALVVQVFSNVIATLAVKKDRMFENLDPLLLATDLADYLVNKNIPFRQSHKIIGKIVSHCIQTGTALTSLTIAELKQFCDSFESDALDAFKWPNALKHRDLPGGTGPQSVMNQIRKAQEIIGS